MCTTDYLMPFVEVSRALSDGVDNHSVMSLIAQRITETLNIKGVMVKLKTPNGEGRLDLLSAYGLSEHFMFSEPANVPDSICYRLPDRVVCISDIKNTEHVTETETMLYEGILAVSVVPIEVEQQVVAMVALFSQTPREFTKTEISFVEALAGRGILSFIYKRRIDESIERERQYLRSFQEISNEINATLNISKVLELVVTKVTQVLGAKGCAVRLLDSKTRNLYLAKAYGLSDEFLNKGPVDAEKSISDNMAGKIFIVEDVYTDPRLQYRAQTIEEGIRKILSIPLMVRGKVIGVLRVYSGERPAFSNREIQFATALAQQSAFAIENARMYQRVKYEYQQMMIDFGYDGSSQ